MKTAIATVSISGSLPDKLAAIQRAGFDAVEIFEADFLTFDATPKEVGQMVRDHGLEVALFQPFRDFESMPEPQRSRAFERARRKFHLMNELGTDLALFCSNCSPLCLGGVDRAAGDFNALGAIAQSFGVRVGYEALAWGAYVNDHRDAWEIARRADHPAIGLILDSFHTLARGIDPRSIRSIPADKIFFVQLADAPAFDMDLLYWSRHFRNMPGEGDLDVIGFMRAVAATGYDGYVSLEIFNDQFRGGSARSISVDGHRSLIALMDRVRRLEPDIAITVPPMPDRISLSNVEFVEFAASAEEAAALGAMLSTMGFSLVGKHVAKDVTVWSQGGARIVINTSKSGPAHSAWLVHGFSVCDMGLKVSDAKATVARAEALGAETFEQETGPGEMQIPAIRGVGGSVLHFIDERSGLDRVWDVEFRPAISASMPADAGITRIDHVAQTMAFDEMLTWLLFYTSIFDAAKTPMVDVIDPAGVVRSQAISTPDGAVRFTLNGAENRKTVAGHFIAENYGSSVQHIAFGCADIFKAAEALAANGFEALPISPNYYDDLDARFGLDEDMLARLKAGNILYDRDDHGEYFQIYSGLFAEGMFFELVERRGSYNGYGAPNAGFRIAAQRKMLRPKGMPRS